MKTGWVIAALAAGIVGGAAQAQSVAGTGTPAALVEEVVGTPRGVDFMDYLSAGQKLTLGPKEGVTLSYLASCWRETILGGTVTIGRELSEVVGGAMTREKVACDGGKLNLTVAQAETAGAVVVRSLKRPPAPEPQLTLFGRSPIVTGPAGAALVVERLDEPGDRVEAKLSARGAHDFAAVNVSFEPGLYRATVNDATVVFKIDPSAASGRAPAVGRLLRFPTP